MIYLASNSPRRRELLDQISVSYQLWVPENEHDAVDETPIANEKVIDYVTRLAKLKAQMGWDRLIKFSAPRYPVLAADTTVCFNDKILGKPNSPQEAKEFLHLLSNQKHQVYTAVALTYQEMNFEALSISDVYFKSLTDKDIEWYINSGEYKDKAGGYALQGKAAVFIRRIEGSPSGIIGLPLYETQTLLNQYLSTYEQSNSG